MLITSRLRNWSGAVEPLQLDVLEVEDAAAFLLERTAGARRSAPDEEARARALALELGQLALALKQAGAYIRTEWLSLAQDAERWAHQRETVLTWFDERQMQHPLSVAVTWQTSFERLSVEGQYLLKIHSRNASGAAAIHGLRHACLPVPFPGHVPDGHLSPGSYTLRWTRSTRSSFSAQSRRAIGNVYGNANGNGNRIKTTS